ncbi:hypothetical protein QQ045_010454 [Rhodiola kirilowii]
MLGVINYLVGWTPTTSGYSISLAVHGSRCGYIIRNCRGSLEVAGHLLLAEDNFMLGLAEVWSIANEYHIPISSIQSSHRDTAFLQANVFKGPWENFVSWRDLKKLLQGTDILDVHPCRNNVAIALAFSREWNVHSTVSFLDLPFAARMAFMGDYLRLPSWRRSDHLVRNSSDGSSSSFGSFVASNRHVWLASSGFLM